MDQVVQVIGALLILVAFAAAQFGSMSTESRAYLVMNLVGSAILAVLAVIGRQWGFVLLETAWAIVSAWSLARQWIGVVARSTPESSNTQKSRSITGTDTL